MELSKLQLVKNKSASLSGCEKIKKKNEKIKKMVGGRNAW